MPNLGPMIDPNLYPVILAGGRGKRLWPLSRGKLPKQFLKIIGGKSPIEICFENALKVAPLENIYVVTLESYFSLVREYLPEIHPENILLEPTEKNTGPSIIRSALHLAELNPKALQLSICADNYFSTPEALIAAIQKGCAYLSSSAERLLTFGIPPRYPETGYGYLLVSEERAGGIQKVVTFVEKPDKIEAEKLIAGGKTFWNSGLFLWRVDACLNELARTNEVLSQQLSRIAPIRNKSRKNYYQEYAKIEASSIDAALLSRSDKLDALPLDTGWVDVGSFTSLFSIMEKDGRNNAIDGRGIVFQGKNNLVTGSDGHKFIGLIGVDNLIVVETSDALLVASMDHAQQVKDFVALLEKSEPALIK